MKQAGKLYLFCGKMAAGKSTLAREIAQRENAVLIVQDEWLEQLFPDEIMNIPDFVKYSSRLQNVLTRHITALLSQGVSVVLDFPGNTRLQREWFRALFESAIADHELHYVDVSDEVCKRQLRERSNQLPEGSAFTSEAEFDAITKYFQEPSDDEGFNIIRHVKA
ncbi:AAA family ATPase [Leptolyngbya sp. NIES-2104]|uniref:AAA family ATPase n=1 Tax=Leptolyngbya sp. NIES-2104 TaxID=1552121 RepID=UPI00073ED4A2|nr:ATP-binding protein [Leptolyngbya sp. NIES-2104]